MIDLNSLVAHFIQIAKIADVTISEQDIIVEKLSAPHSPPKDLPEGKITVYIFFWKDQCLKVGKVGQRSQARYTSQHYNPNSSQSNLAKSILKDKSNLGLVHINEESVGNWIKQETTRINFLLNEDLGIYVLSLLEAFLQCKLKPRYEGFETQK